MTLLSHVSSKSCDSADQVSAAHLGNQTKTDKRLIFIDPEKTHDFPRDGRCTKTGSHALAVYAIGKIC